MARGEVALAGQGRRKLLDCRRVFCGRYLYRPAEYLRPLMTKYGWKLADLTDHRTVAPSRKTDLKPSELARFKAFLGAG
jgi:hypothetical protein